MERQMIFVAAGLIIFAIVSNIDYREYRSIVPAAGIVIMVLLVAVFFFPEVNGATRWIPLGFFALQPAEFAKIVVIVALASLLAPHASREDLMSGPRQLSWAKVGQAVLVVSVPGALIYLEPDLGTTLVFGFIVFGMLFVAGASWRQLSALVTTVGVAGLVIWRFDLLQEHQLDRLQVLWNPDIDPQGIGYQLRQSINAVGSGQFNGRGLFPDVTAAGFQYVPEAENDFIFTAVAEQLGFIGGVLVIFAFSILVWRLLVIAANARDRFGALIAAGVASMIAFHVFVNIGMTIGIMPVTGLPLPFLSQGGSFYIAMALSLGIANSVWLMRTPVPGENQLT
jgi:rod shape determining protein RodA